MTKDDEPTADDVIDKATALIADLDRLEAEYADLTTEERAALPESVRRFFEGERGPNVSRS